LNSRNVFIIYVELPLKIRAPYKSLHKSYFFSKQQLYKVNRNFRIVYFFSKMEVTSYVSHVLTHLQSRNTNSVLIHSPTIQTSDFFFFNSLTRKYGIKRRGIYKHNTYRYIENKISSIINSISSYRFNVELNLTAPSVVPGRMSISNRHCILQVFIPFILQSNGCF
jgi:hypothetical protein